MNGMKKITGDEEKQDMNLIDKLQYYGILRQMIFRRIDVWWFICEWYSFSL